MNDKLNLMKYAPPVPDWYGVKYESSSAIPKSPKRPKEMTQLEFAEADGLVTEYLELRSHPNVVKYEEELAKWEIINHNTRQDYEMKRMLKWSEYWAENMLIYCEADPFTDNVGSSKDDG